MSDNPPVKAPIDVEDEDVSYRARWASMHIRENLAAIQKDIDALVRRRLVLLQISANAPPAQ